MPGTPLRVLVVAGDRGAADLVRRLLAKSYPGSYEVSAAFTYEEGLERARAEKPDVCMVDHRLPVRDGIAFIADLKTRAPGLPPILLTEAEDSDVDRRGLQAGAVDYLYKAELTPHRLDRAVRYAAEREHRRREQAATRRQLRFQADLLAAVGQGVLAMTLKGRLLYWNAAAERLLGRSGEDLRDRTADEVGLPVLGGPAAPAIRSALSRGETWTGEVHGRREDGSTLALMLTASPLTGDTGTVQGVIVVASDIDSMKRTEAALRERVKELRVLHEVTRILNDLERPMEERLQSLVEALPEGWMRPEHTAARLVVEGREYRSSGFRETPWMLRAPVDHGGSAAGRIQVAALEAVPEDPFLPEEQGLLDNVGRLIGDRLRQDRLGQMLVRTVAALDEAVLVVYGRTIVDANPAAERIFGYGRDELLGRSTEFLHLDPGSARRFGEATVPILERDGVFRGAYRMRRQDGSVFDSEHTVTLLNPEEGIPGGAVSVVRDVSERARKEAELRESEERFRQIAENIGSVFWITNPDRTNVEYVSPAFTAIWGRPVEELLEDPDVWLLSVLPSDRPRVLEILEDRRHRGYEMEYQIVRPDGQVRWILDRAYPVRREGRVVRIIGVAEDVTDRKHAEERFSVLGQEMADGIQVIGTDGTIEFASPSSQAILGYAPEELEGRDVFTLVHPEDRAAMVEMFRTVVAKAGTVARRQYRGLARDGTVRELESVGRNAIDHPAVQGIIVTTRNITERNALEAQLRQSQKMEAVGRLAGGIAHDFNNILTVIRSQADLVRMELEGGTAPDLDALSAEVGTIAEAADRAANLTSQLLAFSREQILQPRTVDLSGIALEMSKLLARVIGEDIALETRLAEDLPPVRVDPIQLENAIMNLAVNARDAMPEGGVLTLETRLVPRDPSAAGGPVPGEVDAAESAGARAVALEVTDSGTGMDPETLTRCFEPFYTTKEKGKGTGLGLAMAYGFVTQSGGNLSVDSEPGRGTRFSLQFPAVSGPPDPRPSRTRARVASSVRGGRVLVVEDDDAVRRVARRILEQAGIEVEAVGTAEAALALLETDKGFQLVLTDLVLPGMTGLQLLDRIQLPGDVPVVVMSGYAEEAAQGAASARDLPETVSFLSKPFTADTLVEHVRQVMATRGPGDGRKP
ncbi:MAG TPA: PAS domain S-box protein [Longimicrobiales bacterium]|nr:PAS domain S-box protein [Longimicrobiales bacterium]